MTVAELIEKLQALPPDAKVIISGGLDNNVLYEPENVALHHHHDSKMIKIHDDYLEAWEGAEGAVQAVEIS